MTTASRSTPRLLVTGALAACLLLALVGAELFLLVGTPEPIAPAAALRLTVFVFVAPLAALFHVGASRAPLRMALTTAGQFLLTSWAAAAALTLADRLVLAGAHDLVHMAVTVVAAAIAGRAWWGSLEQHGWPAGGRWAAWMAVWAIPVVLATAGCWMAFRTTLSSSLPLFSRDVRFDGYDDFAGIHHYVLRAKLGPDEYERWARSLGCSGTNDEFPVDALRPGTTPAWWAPPPGREGRTCDAGGCRILVGYVGGEVVGYQACDR